MITENMHQVITVAIGDHAITYHAMETNAPKDYDGFGTFCVLEYGEALSKAEEATIRVVLIDARHLQWQVGRYQSGNHFTRISALPESAFKDYLWNRIWGKV